jgi:hypothetical protein
MTNEEKINSPTYYAIIPSNVRYSDLKPNAKLLYGEITALSNKHGFCFATNNYFAELYNVSKNTVSVWLRQLKEKNFIEIEIIYNDKKQVIKRNISIIKNNNTPIIKKDNCNNTSINNTSNNIYKRKDDFERKVQSLDYDYITKIDFIDYWTETNKSGTKMRWELEKTWDFNLRMKRWVKQSWKGPNKKPTSKIKNSFNTLNKAKELLNKIK